MFIVWAESRRGCINKPYNSTRWMEEKGDEEIRTLASSRVANTKTRDRASRTRMRPGVAWRVKDPWGLGTYVPKVLNGLLALCSLFVSIPLPALPEYLHLAVGYEH